MPLTVLVAKQMSVPVV